MFAGLRPLPRALVRVFVGRCCLHSHSYEPIRQHDRVLFWYLVSGKRQNVRIHHTRQPPCTCPAHTHADPPVYLRHRITYTHLLPAQHTHSRYNGKFYGDWAQGDTASNWTSGTCYPERSLSLGGFIYMSASLVTRGGLVSNTWLMSLGCGALLCAHVWMGVCRLARRSQV